LQNEIPNSKPQIPSTERIGIWNLEFGIGIWNFVMRLPQVLVYETDGRLAELLRRAGEARRWSLREPRRLESCLRLLERGGPSVLVVKVGTDLVRELTLLERVAWLYPDTAAVVVGDSENSVLAGLAWDLGATFVLFPPFTRHDLPDLVARLLTPGADWAAPVLASATDADSPVVES
jgi:DNA-binding NtrC family response regulator